MKLDRVTVTGADDSTSIGEMIDLSFEFPFVEWGILVSNSNAGKPRFPTAEWIADLQRAPRRIESLSLHLCGRWVREVCSGNWEFVDHFESLEGFSRIQLNFHSYAHLLTDEFFDAARTWQEKLDCQLIFQCDGKNDHLVSDAYNNGIDAVPLYDKSGGAGILPDDWPQAAKNVYSGYAGGLDPDNIAEQLAAISVAANNNEFWVDAETRLRPSDNSILDMGLVREFLVTTQPFVGRTNENIDTK